MSEQTYDVLIAGGGLVGASLAAALAPLPLKVAVVEAVPFGTRGQPSYDDRVTAVSFGSRRIFESIGLWTAIAPEATPIHHIHVSERGRLGATHLHAREAGVDALGYVVPNRVIGQALSAFLPAQSNISLIAPAKLIEFNEQPGGLHARLETADQPRDLDARLLVAADGANSRIRERLGIAGRNWDYGQSAVICNVTVERPQQGVAYERFTDAGPLALLPMGGDRYALIWTVEQARLEATLALDDAAFLLAAAAPFNGRFGRFVKAGKRQAYPLSMVRAAAQLQGRCVIAGNAAHSLHPIAGQGFNLSLRDVALLAETLSDIARSGGDVGNDPRLQGYVTARRRDQVGTALFTDFLTRMFTNPLLPVRVLRNAGLLGLELLPPLRHALMQHNMGLAGRLPRLARGVPLP
ncbi:MAG TPA: 2-octaprenyl-6-methoxyphenyl hydroxylase [Gammaproteobacteria bacterium]|nr:2-octaprenyl-6-methoxyphenyl hydroxylase [Gammaproteobacteria bacterium]